MLRELQKKARPKIDTNLDEAKRLAAMDLELKKQKESDEAKKKGNFGERTRTKIPQQQ